MPHHIALLAGACEVAGQIEEAVTLLDDALQVAEGSGERLFVAGTKTLQGPIAAAARAPRGGRGTLLQSSGHCRGAG